MRVSDNIKRISIVADGETGVVERVLECLSAQGLDISCITANGSGVGDKMTINITLPLEDDKVNKVIKRLEKLVPVYSAVELKKDDSLTQQLALIKFDSKKISNDLLKDVKSDSNISIILPSGAENNRNNTDGVSILGKNNDYVIVRVAESGEFIDAFVSKYKDAIVDVVKTGDLTIAIK